MAYPANGPSRCPNTQVRGDDPQMLARQERAFCRPTVPISMIANGPSITTLDLPPLRDRL